MFKIIIFKINIQNHSKILKRIVGKRILNYDNYKIYDKIVMIIMDFKEKLKKVD